MKKPKKTYEKITYLFKENSESKQVSFDLIDILNKIREHDVDLTKIKIELNVYDDDNFGVYGSLFVYYTNIEDDPEYEQNLKEYNTWLDDRKISDAKSIAYLEEKIAQIKARSIPCEECGAHKYKGLSMTDCKCGGQNEKA